MAARTALLAVAIALAIAPPALGSTLVRYRSSYAIPNGDYALVVHRDGHATTRLGDRSGGFELTATARKRLRAALRGSGWPTLRGRYRRHGAQPPVGRGPEFVTYRSRQVRIDPGADVPARLERVLTRLHRLWEAHTPGDGPGPR